MSLSSETHHSVTLVTTLSVVVVGVFTQHMLCIEILYLPSLCAFAFVVAVHWALLAATQSPASYIVSAWKRAWISNLELTIIRDCFKCQTKHTRHDNIDGIFMNVHLFYCRGEKCDIIWSFALILHLSIQYHDISCCAALFVMEVIFLTDAPMWKFVADTIFKIHFKNKIHKIIK